MIFQLFLQLFHSNFRSHVLQFLLHQWWQEPRLCSSIAATTKAAPEPRPRPTLQILDRARQVGNLHEQIPPEAVPLTERNLALGTTPAPRPQNRDILHHRATSVHGSASARSQRSRKSRSRRRQQSRSPRRSSGSGRNAPHPPTELPPGVNGNNFLAFGLNLWYKYHFRILRHSRWHRFQVLQYRQQPPVPPFSIFPTSSGTQLVVRPPAPPQVAHHGYL